MMYRRNGALSALHLHDYQDLSCWQETMSSFIFLAYLLEHLFLALLSLRI